MELNWDVGIFRVQDSQPVLTPACRMLWIKYYIYASHFSKTCLLSVVLATLTLKGKDYGSLYVVVELRFLINYTSFLTILFLASKQ